MLNYFRHVGTLHINVSGVCMQFAIIFSDIFQSERERENAKMLETFSDKIFDFIDLSEKSFQNVCISIAYHKIQRRM